ncbi:EAL domain-containing response regulator [Pseudoalteromonas luteoviolacea]|uniref:EAL domain-containing response regulator n=1 Tax=Pseudoalteromonas luteoviolacea TaxID=43657 RepID=UPI001B3A649F|nr:EAL domain-containing response regulator [Pseudoalteromonas luteoviolacea]MBQ4879840.1 EAL domain-containing response regulator [Pseudoalteromonas luteoviolacea]MBQ4908856.1 EAL domain-containing response regulator [Pseudoalteromonas luteoviolacea]
MTLKKQYEALNVLVIDDDDFIHDMLTHEFNQLGVENIQVEISGVNALKRIKNGECFDLIIIDLIMPDMDGIEVLRHLSEYSFKGAVILLSGQDQRILDTTAALAGAQHIRVLGAIPKPITIEVLNQKLNRLFEEKAPVFNPITKDICLEELKEAIAHDEIIPFYQPQLDFSTGQLKSIEVLARWAHPRRGIVGPASFITMAEETGMIDAITRSIFRQALKQFKELSNIYGEQLNLSINLSTDSLCAIDLPEQIEDLANIHGIPCNSITLELTESRLIQNLVSTLDVLLRLRLKGFGLSIDDFGTGYSSLEQLKKIPFTELKIDRQFISDATNNKTCKAIIESSVSLAKTLSMHIVAEGVETQADWDLARDLKCDLAQGYFISKPLPFKDFVHWLNNQLTR